MSETGQTCSKCPALRASYDKLSQEKECLLAAQQFVQKPNMFSSAELKVKPFTQKAKVFIYFVFHIYQPLLQEILNERTQYLEQIQNLQVKHKKKIKCKTLLSLTIC